MKVHHRMRYIKTSTPLHLECLVTKKLRYKESGKKIKYHKNLFTESEYIEIYQKFYDDNLKLNMPKYL